MMTFVNDPESPKLKLESRVVELASWPIHLNNFNILNKILMIGPIDCVVQTISFGLRPNH